MASTATSAPTPRSPRTLGAHHVGLTVPDLPAAVTFFEDALGFTAVGGRPDYPSVFVSDGTTLITLWQAVDPETAAPFDRKRNIGLHHLALRVPTPGALAELHDELAARDDVTIEFAPDTFAGGAGQHLMCAIPGGVRLELVALKEA